MYLKQLLGFGAAGFAEWRDMWNGEIMPYLRSLRPLAGNGICTEEKADGTVINATAVRGASVDPGPTSDPYNSYFKLTLANVSSGGAVVPTVTVADGATGGDSIAVLNGYSSYRLPPYVENVDGGRLYYLKYTPAVYGSGGGLVSSATMNIGSVATSGASTPALPAGSGAYVQLGRVLWSAGNPRVVQDFTAGVADVRWYVSCY